MVVCLLATISYCACIPINPSSTEDEVKFELGNVKAKAVIVMEEASAHIKKAALDLGIIIIMLRPKSSSLFPPRRVSAAGKECSILVTVTNSNRSY